MVQSKDKEPKSPMRRNWVGPVGSDASAAAMTAFARAGFLDPTLVLRWTEIAGAETARIAQPVKFTDAPGGGTLTLKAEPGAAVFLQHETRSLADRINTFLGRPAVARLRFVPGAISARPVAKRRKRFEEPFVSNDPANRYRGSEALGNALLRLAQARRRPPSDEQS